MSLIKLTFIFLLSLFIITGCAPAPNFLKSTEYTGNKKLDNLFVLVVSDEKARGCLYVYRNSIVDSLRRSGIRSEGGFACCRDKKTDIQDMLNRNMPVGKDYQYLLEVMVYEVVTDIYKKHSLSRKLQLILANYEDQTKPLWEGELKIDFESFQNTEDYVAEAHKLVKATLKELRSKGMF